MSLIYCVLVLDVLRLVYYIICIVREREMTMKNLTFTELDNLAGGTFVDDTGVTWAVHKKTASASSRKNG